MTTPVWSSELACQALRLSPHGDVIHSPLTQELGQAVSACDFCGRPLDAHTPAVQLKLKPTFSDVHRLASGSEMICGWCSAVSDQSVLRSFQRCVFNKDGVYSLGTDAHRAWFWLTPPEPPFVVVINHSVWGVYHYVWRTPVTLDAKMVWATVDDVAIQIRRPQVLQALKDAAELREAVKRQAIKKVPGLGNPYLSPFSMLNRKAYSSASMSHAQISPLARELALLDPAARGALDRLSKLSSPELWALSCFLKAKAEIPTQPPIQTSADASSGGESASEVEEDAMASN